MLLVGCQDQHKVGIVVSSRLFNEFNGVQDLKKRHSAELVNVGAALDSLKSQLQNTNPIDTVKVAQIQSEITNLQVWLQTNTELVNTPMFSGIVSQVNTGIQEFGKQNGYSYILGASLDGNVLYADSLVDVTDQAIKFLNENY